MRKYPFSKQSLIIFLAVIALLATSLVFQSSVLEQLVQPAALALWAAWRVILSINQAIYWGGLIIVGLLLTLRLVPIRGQPVSRYQYDEQPKPTPELDEWYNLFISAPFELRKSSEVNEKLFQLLASYSNLINEYDGEPTGFWKKKLPQEISTFLFPDPRKKGGIFTRWKRIQLALPFTKHIWGERAEIAYYDAVEQVLTFIEHEMENQNDKFQI